MAPRPLKISPTNAGILAAILRRVMKEKNMETRQSGIEDRLTAARLRRERAADMVGVAWDELEKALPREVAEREREYLRAVDVWTAAIRTAAQVEVEYERFRKTLVHPKEV